jgi:hypothetical protein
VGVGGGRYSYLYKDLESRRKMEEYPTTHICTLCGAEYIRGGYGYCDESLECAMDSGEHLVAV